MSVANFTDNIDMLGSHCGSSQPDQTIFDLAGFGQQEKSGLVVFDQNTSGFLHNNVDTSENIMYESRRQDIVSRSCIDRL